MQMIVPGQAIQQNVPASWLGGRINAYYKDPTTNPLAFDKVELTVTGGAMNFDITYVDYLALPSQITVPSGTVCANNSNSAACKVPIYQLLNNCPKGDDYDLYDAVNQRCLSAGLYCSYSQNASSSFCNLLSTTINQCTSNPSLYPNCNLGAGDTTDNVYSCSGYFDGQPPNHSDGNKWCAILNRGALGNPTPNDPSVWYQNSPFNQYAAYVHQQCGQNVYSFAYDDYQNPGPDKSCTTNQLNILFCPANAA
jgi:hypothetical protein